MSDQSLPVPAATDAGQPLEGEPRLHEEIRYEESDISVRGVIAVLVGITIVFAGVIGVAYWFLRANETSAGSGRQCVDLSHAVRR